MDLSTVREIRFFPYLRLFLSTLAYFEKDGLGHTIKNRGLIMLKALVSTALAWLATPDIAPLYSATALKKKG